MWLRSDGRSVYAIHLLHRRVIRRIPRTNENALDRTATRRGGSADAPPTTAEHSVPGIRAARRGRGHRERRGRRGGGRGGAKVWLPAETRRHARRRRRRRHAH
jgi:hypothetical protein